MDRDLKINTNLNNIKLKIIYMAQLNMDIPDPALPRIIAAFTFLVQEGDVIDIENPTNQEILIVLKRYIKDSVMRRVDAYERDTHDATFTPVDIDMT